MADAPVQPGEVAAAAAAPLTAGIVTAQKINSYYGHLGQALKKDYFDDLTATGDSEDGNLCYVKIIHGEAVHDLPTFCAQVAAVPTAYPEFLVRPSAADPGRCCAVNQNGTRCKLHKSSNDETCTAHSNQSLASLLTDYDNRPMADKCMCCFKKVKGAGVSSSYVRCIACPRFAHAVTSSNVGCISSMLEVGEDASLVGICQFCFTYRTMQLMLLPVPDYGDQYLPHIKPRALVDGAVSDDGVLGLPIAGATPVRLRPMDHTPAPNSKDSSTVSLTNTAPPSFPSEIDTPPNLNQLAGPALPTEVAAAEVAVEPLGLHRNQRGEEVRDEFAKRLERVKDDNQGLQRMKDELAAAAKAQSIKDELASRTQAASAVVVERQTAERARSQSELETAAVEIAKKNSLSDSKAQANSGSSSKTTSDAKLDQLMALIAAQNAELKGFKEELKKVKSQSDQVQPPAGPSPRPQDSSNQDDGKKGLKGQYKNSSGYSSDDERFVENFSMLAFRQPGLAVLSRRVLKVEL